MVSFWDSVRCFFGRHDFILKHRDKNNNPLTHLECQTCHHTTPGITWVATS